MNLLRIQLRFQEPAQKNPCSRSRRGPLTRLGVDPRCELLEGIVCRTDFLQLVGDLSKELLGGTAAIVLDVREMSRRDAKVRSESAQGVSGSQTEPAHFLA